MTNESNEHISIIIIILCLFAIIYAIKTYFDSYESKYDIVKATIESVKCQRFIISNMRAEYQCILNVNYKYKGFPIDGNLVTEGTSTYFVGEEIDISVNKENPIEIGLPNISKKVTATIISLFSVAILGLVFSYKYINLP